MSTRHQHRIQSSLQLFLEACRLWGQTFENEDLLYKIEDMEDTFEYIDMAECSEEMVQQVENATVHLIDSMDHLFKAIGGPGFCHGEVRH